MKQGGFTLLELIIAIALGLIVIAAASILLITGHKSLLMQQGNSDLQDNANFGLNYIARDIRLSNLNTETAVITDTLPKGGVILSLNNVPIVPDSAWKEEYQTRSSTGLTNVNNVSGGTVGSELKSDVLTIQYLPVQTGGMDCEGTEIDDINQMVIQRYFLRADSNSLGTEPSNLALVCDAGRYKPGEALEGMGTDSQIIMKRVEYFRVLLGVVGVKNDEANKDKFKYLDATSYMAFPAANRPRIVSISLGLLARSPLTVGQDKAVDDSKAFTILDKTVRPKNQNNSPKFIRQVISQNITLRNALGERE